MSLRRQTVTSSASTYDIGGRRRNTLLDIYKQGDAGTGEGEIHYWIFTSKEMLAREKEKYIIGYLQTRRC